MSERGNDNRNKDAMAVNPLLGTLELALFMDAGVKRFSNTVDAAKRSFVIPFFLMLFWVYPLSVVPTEIMGARSYGNLVFIHGLTLVLSIAISCTLLWKVAQKLEKSDKFWRVVMMINFTSLTAFAVTCPLLLSVLAGAHTWGDVFGGLILITYYELAIVAYIITRGLAVPWQFGAGLSFLFMFVDNASISTVFYLTGVQS